MCGWNDLYGSLEGRDESNSHDAALETVADLSLQGRLALPPDTLQIFEALPLCIRICTPGGHGLEYVNAAFERIWQRPVELGFDRESLKKSVFESDRDAWGTLCNREFLNQPIEAEYRIKLPDGALKWVRSRSFPILDHAGRIARRIEISEEITEVIEQRHQLQALQSECVTAASDYDKIARIVSSQQLSNGLLGFCLTLAQRIRSELGVERVSIWTAQGLASMRCICYTDKTKRTVPGAELDEVPIHPGFKRNRKLCVSADIASGVELADERGAALGLGSRLPVLLWHKLMPLAVIQLEQVGYVPIRNSMPAMMNVIVAAVQARLCELIRASREEEMVQFMSAF